MAGRTGARNMIQESVGDLLVKFPGYGSEETRWGKDGFGCWIEVPSWIPMR